MINVIITGYAKHMIGLRSALQELIESLQDDINLEMNGKTPKGNLYAGDEEFCQLFLKISAQQAVAADYTDSIDKANTPSVG